MSEEVRPWSTGTSASAVTMRQRRAAVHAMTGGRCFYCGLPVRLEAEPLARDWILVRGESRMIIEHKTPVKRGGADKATNHVPSCGGCNRSKSSLTIDEFRFVRALRAGDLAFRFFGDSTEAINRDWLCCHSRAFERVLVVRNIPHAVRAYGRGRLVGK